MNDLFLARTALMGLSTGEQWLYFIADGFETLRRAREQPQVALLFGTPKALHAGPVREACSAQRHSLIQPAEFFRRKWERPGCRLLIWA